MTKRLLKVDDIITPQDPWWDSSERRQCRWSPSFVGRVAKVFESETTHGMIRAKWLDNDEVFYGEAESFKLIMTGLDVLFEVMDER